MSRLGPAAIAFLGLAGLLINAVTLGPALRNTLGGVTDFMDLYAGGKLAFTGDLYVPDRVLETEARTEGWSSPTRLFMRLPCFALFFWPLAQLPYPAASALWEILCVFGLIAFVAAWPANRRWQAALACCWSLPVWMTVAEGQDIGFLLLWIALALMLVRRDRPLTAGVVASLCLAKFQLFFMIPVWICARKRWRFASGLLAGCIALAALSFAIGGWNWPLRYYALLREPANNPYREVMPNLHALLAGLPHANAFAIAGAGAVAVAVWVASRGWRREWGLAAALAGGIVVAPHAFMADCALLIPAALLLIKSATDRWTAYLGLYLLTPIPWVLLVTGNGFTTRLAICAFVLSLGWQGWRDRAPKAASARAHSSVSA